LCGSGTISGPVCLDCELLRFSFFLSFFLSHLQGELEYGSLLEYSLNGKRPFKVNGQERSFLLDGDTINLKGYCQGMSCLFWSSEFSSCRWWLSHWFWWLFWNHSSCTGQDISQRWEPRIVWLLSHLRRFIHVVKINCIGGTESVCLWWVFKKFDSRFRCLIQICEMILIFKSIDKSLDHS
jgi:hypothetical protein